MGCAWENVRDKEFVHVIEEGFGGVGCGVEFDAELALVVRVAGRGDDEKKVSATHLDVDVIGEFVEIVIGEVHNGLLIGRLLRIPPCLFRYAHVTRVAENLQILQSVVVVIVVSVVDA